MNTTTWKNRALSVVLTVIMVFSMLPLSVFAASGAVAEVDGTAYTNLIEAFDAAQGKDSATVKLLADVSASGYDGDSEYCVSYGGYNFKSGKVTLDLNGQTLTWTASSGKAPCVYGATLTVQDSQGGGKLYSEDGEALQIISGTLNIQSGTIESEGGNALQIQGGDVHITGGTIKSSDYFGEGVYVSPDTVNNRTATLTVSGSAQLIGGDHGNGLYVSQEGNGNPTVSLSGGTYTGGSNGIKCSGTTVGALLEENCRYMLSGSAVTETNVNTLAGGVTVAPDPNAPVAYIDADGNPATQSGCTEITAATKELTNGWYAVKNDVTISGDLSVTGPQYVYLILCDGATLTVTGSVRLKNANYSLNIYGQSEHTGTLKAGSAESTVPAIAADASARSHLYIYGGTVTVQAKSGTYSIGETTNKGLSFETGSEMKTVRTDDQKTYMYWYDNSGASLTITKCKDHIYVYDNRGDLGHTSRCDLCNKIDYSITPHSYTGWTDNGNGTHTGTCACGAESTEDHTLTFTPNEDGLTHSGKCSKCGYEATAENHDFSLTDQWGKQCACDAYLTATYNNRNYATLASAIKAAENGGTVKLEKGVGENITIADGMTVTIDLNKKIWTTDGAYAHPTLTVTGGSVTVKNGTLETGSSSNADTAAVVESGKLTVGENMTIQGGSTGLEATPYTPAIEVNGGELTLSVGTKLVCGMKVADGKTLKNYLPADTAFAVDGSIIDGYVQGYVRKFTLTVVEHKTHSYTDGVCDCGFVCGHTGGNSREASYFQKAVCAICHNEYGEVMTDNTAPTGSITVKERTWFEGLINKITFGLFFKEDVTATVTATDDSYDQPGYEAAKHAVNIKYLVSDKELTNEELQAQTFTDYAKAIDLTDEQNYVVYARLTDHAGNVTYLSTDGFVIDKTAPSINDFTDGQEVHICGTSYTVSIKDANLDTVTLDGKEQSGDTIQFRYNYNGVEEHTVVATDKAGNTSTVTFFQHQGHDFDSETCVCKNYCGTTAAAKVQIGDEEANLYGTFDEAWDSILRVTKPVKLTLLANADIDGGYVGLGNFDLTIDLNGYTFGYAEQEFLLADGSNAGTSKLTVTGAGSFLSSILVGTNGRLTVEADVNYIKGVKISFSGEDSPTNWSVALKGGKYGELDLNNDDYTQAAGKLGDLLAPGYVFENSDTADSTNAIGAKVVPCPDHTWNNGVCSTCKLPCPHELITNGECMICHMTIVAMDDANNYYYDLNAAFEGVADGGKVTLLTNVTGTSTLDVDKTITLNMAGYKLSVSDSAALIVKSGYLTVTNSTGEYIDISGRMYSVRMNGGTLKFEKKVKLGGLSVMGVYDPDTEKYTSRGTLEGGLKEGSIITGGVYVDGYDYSTGKGYENALALLPDGYAFAEYQADGTAGSLLRADYSELDGDLIVVAHQHGPFTYDDINLGYYCACGYCHFKHVYDKSGHCTLCAYVCPHDWHYVSETEDGRWVCGDCEAELAAKVEKDGSTTYYAKHFEARYPYAEDTLREVFNKAPDGSTVTLLADGLYAFGWITGKNITLELNGKNLIENNGIVVDIDSDTKTGGRLFVSGKGSSRAPEGISYTCTFRVLKDSKLVLNENFSGDYGTIYLEDGVLTSDSTNMKIGALVIQNSAAQITLKGGQFEMISIDGEFSMTAGSLLEQGYAFQKDDGSYVAYDTEISQASSLENVTVVKCDHEMTELPKGSQYYNHLYCPNCDEGLFAVLTTADGKINGYEDLDGDGSALEKAETTPGCTVTMYYDAEWLSIRSTAEGFTLDANDCTIAQLELHEGTLTVKNATITGSTRNFGFTVKTYSDFFGTFRTTLTLENCEVQELEGAESTTLSTNGPLTLKNTLVNGKTSVFSDTDEGLTVEESELNGEVTVRGNLIFKSGNASTSKITVYGAAEISDGTINELNCSDAGSLTVSGGRFGKITAPDGKRLIDCLKDGYAFYYNSVKLADGRSSTLEDVYVAEHTHGEYSWDTATQELVCACGNVKETDAAAPTFDGIADGETYYQNTLTFTVADTGSGLASVKDGDTVLTADENGNYTVTADNKAHTITATDNAGNTATVTVTVYKVYKITLPNGTGYTLTGADTVGHGEEYIFDVRLDDGYSRVPGSYKVTANGVELTAMAGDNSYDQYWIPSVTGDLTITVEGIADITAPAVEMAIGENKFNKLLNSLTFGLFFKKTQTVTVTATDLGSGVDNSTAAYLVADGLFDKTSMPTEGWISFDMKNGKGSFSVEPNAMGSVYVRVKDKDGNLALINSDGVVVYTDSTAITEHITFTRLSDEDVSFKVNLNGNWFDRLLISDGKTTSSINGIISSDGTVSLKNEELRKLAAGEYTITVTYSPLGQKYVEAEGNDAPAATTVKLTVVRATRTTLAFSAPDAVYDGKAYDNLTITDKPDGTIVEYMVDGSYTTAAPKDAGTYTVKITTPQDENYNPATFTKNFTISPKEVTITGVTAAAKVYDGSAEAEIESIGTLNGVESGDELTIIKGKATFDSKNAGSGKTVTFEDFALTGSAASNYKLTAQPASVTADINRKALTVENLKVKDKLYDGTNKAEIDGTPALKGVVDGDTLTLVNGTPTFDSIKAGKDISVSFTDFNLLGDDETLLNYSLSATPTGITADINEWAATGDEFTTTTQDWSYRDFTVTAKTGYQLSLTDTADGSWTDTLTAPKQTTGVYSFTFYVKDTATGAISTAVTREYKIDRSSPDGTVTLTFGGRSFTSDNFIFPYGITFDTFSNEDVTVTVTGTDVGSGVKSVSYYKSDKALTDTQVVSITDWTEIDGDHFTIKAEDMPQFVLYIYIEDNAGNGQYLTANGVVFDTTVPEIVGIDNGKTYYVTQRVFVDDTNLKSVTLNGSEMAMDSYFELAGDIGATYTVVATDKAGNVTTYTVTMKPISDITDAIKDITEENVKSSDVDAIDAVTQQILDIAAESDEDVIGAEQWNKLLAAAENCKKLEQRIAEVSAEITRLTEAVSGYDIDKVTSADKADIEQLITDIDALLVTDNLTDAERAALEALKQTAQAQLDRIADAKGAAESDEITAVKDITKDNVALGDKDALEKTEKALEKALDDFGGNYTDDECKALNDKLDTVKAALAAIENAEKAAEEIEKLPSADDVKLSDKDEVERVSKIIDALTENEKSMLGETAIGKLKALNDKLSEPAADKPTSPSTGDTSSLALWIALLFISGGVVTVTTGVSRKKRHS